MHSTDSPGSVNRNFKIFNCLSTLQSKIKNLVNQVTKPLTFPSVIAENLLVLNEVFNLRIPTDAADAHIQSLIIQVNSLNF